MGLDSVGQAWIYDYRSACPSFEVLCGVRCAWGTWTIMAMRLHNHVCWPLAGPRNPWNVEKPCRRRSR